MKYLGGVTARTAYQLVVGHLRCQPAKNARVMVVITLMAKQFLCVGFRGFETIGLEKEVSPFQLEHLQSYHEMMV